MAVLLVEDHATTRDVVRQGLRAHGFTVVSVDGVAAAKRAIAEGGDLAGALVDLRLHDSSGLELYEWLSRHRPELAARVASSAAAAASWRAAWRRWAGRPSKSRSTWPMLYGSRRGSRAPENDRTAQRTESLRAETFHEPLRAMALRTLALTQRLDRGDMFTAEAT